MGRDPRSSVVDPQCRVHGVDNLHIASSAVFPTSGQANPTLTLLALALRLADHLVPPESQTQAKTQAHTLATGTPAQPTQRPHRDDSAHTAQDPSSTQGARDTRPQPAVSP